MITATSESELKENTAVRSLLAKAFDVLAPMAESDDECSCCGETDCTIENPDCDNNRARHARWLIDRALTPQPESLRPDRLNNPPERIYFEEWAKQNRRGKGFAGRDYTLLEAILDPNPKAGTLPYPTFDAMCVTHRDQLVASSVVQWFGTNVGRSFIRDCEAKIAREREVRGDLNDAAWQVEANGRPLDVPPTLAETAKIIAARFGNVTKPDFVYLETLLRVSLVQAYERGKTDAIQTLAVGDNA